MDCTRSLNAPDQESDETSAFMEVPTLASIRSPNKVVVPPHLNSAQTPKL